MYVHRVGCGMTYMDTNIISHDIVLCEKVEMRAVEWLSRETLPKKQGGRAYIPSSTTQLGNYHISLNLVTPNTPRYVLLLDSTIPYVFYKVLVKHSEHKSWMTFKFLTLWMNMKTRWVNLNIHISIFIKYCYKNKKLKLCFGNCVVVLNVIFSGMEWVTHK